MKRALVVDDDDAIRALVGTILRFEGFSVDLAQDGMEAMQKVRAGEYDVVVLDLMMPKLDGEGVIAAITSEDQANKPKIVVMTAASPTVVERLPLDKVHSVITKPFELTSFRKAVAEAASGASSPE